MAVQEVHLGRKKVFGVHKGLLHRHLGIPEDEKIGPARIEAASHSSNPTIRAEANSAKGLTHMHRGGGGGGGGRKKLFGK